MRWYDWATLVVFGALMVTATVTAGARQKQMLAHAPHRVTCADVLRGQATMTPEEIEKVVAQASPSQIEFGKKCLGLQ